MRRREVIALLGALGVDPVNAGQRTPRLAVVTPGAFASPELLVSALAEHGYEEGKTLRIDRYYARGSADRLRDMIAEAVASRPDVIFGVSGRTVEALKAANEGSADLRVKHRNLISLFRASVHVAVGWMAMKVARAVASAFHRRCQSRPRRFGRQ